MSNSPFHISNPKYKSDPRTDNLRDQIAKLREEQAKKKAKEGEKLSSIVCQHILFAPPKESVDAFCLQTKNHHPKHDGNIYCCNSCAMFFDQENGLGILSGLVYVAEFVTFQRNIKSIKYR